jgi:hypothetical protein
MLFRFCSGYEKDIPWFDPPPPIAVLEVPVRGSWREQDNELRPTLVRRYFKLVGGRYEQDNLLQLVPT